MKKILLSAFALFASLTMVNAQNLLTAENFSTDLLESYTATDGWAEVFNKSDITTSTGWDAIVIGRTDANAGDWFNQWRIKPIESLVLTEGQNYKLTVTFNLGATEGNILIKAMDKNAPAFEATGAYANGGSISVIIAGSGKPFDVVCDLRLSAAYEGTAAFVLEETDEQPVTPDPEPEPEPESDLLHKTTAYGEVNLDPYFENDPDYTFMHDGWHVVNDWLLMYVGDWGSADMQWDVNVWENAETGAVAYEELATCAATNGDLAGVQLMLIAPAEQCGLVEGDWYQLEMVFATEVPGGALKNWAGLNQTIPTAEEYYTFSEVKQCTGDGISQNDTVGQLLGVGMTFGANGLIPTRGAKFEILGINVYESTEEGERGELVYTTIEIADPVAEEAASVLVYGNEGKIIVAAEGAQVSVYTVAGAKVYEGSKSEIDMAAGVYVVVVDGVATKVIVK